MSNFEAPEMAGALYNFLLANLATSLTSPPIPQTAKKFVDDQIKADQKAAREEVERAHLKKKKWRPRILISSKQLKRIFQNAGI